MKSRSGIVVIGIISVLILMGEVCGTIAMMEKDSLVKSNNTFAFDLYSEIRAERGNLFFSPFSISSALAMTYAGARGETERQMQHVLHFDTDQGKFHKSFEELINNLNQNLGDGIQLSTANALWIQKNYELLGKFLKLVQAHYGAGLNPVDFMREREKARAQINDWVEKETQGKIKDLIKPGVLTELTKLVLTNAIYFKGEWADKFNENLTKKGTFYTDEESEIEALFMRKSGDLKYSENDFTQVLEIPYTGDSMSMVVFLPKPGNSLRDLEESLSGDYQNWISSLRQQEVDVFIPKFKTTSEFNLGDTLSGMGMSAAFSDSADFSGMTGEKDLKIDEVVHKAFVEVNEEGTEAAAATGVVMALAAAPTKPKVFRADHPFLFVIKNARSILFMGRIQKPEYK